MKLTRTLALIAGVTILLTACNREPDDAVGAIQENTNPLLAHVPSDTAYVFAALEPSPKEITDIYIERFQPVFDVIAEQITQFQADYATGNYEHNMMAKLATAVLDEMGGSLNADNLEKFGISMQAHHAFYAIGVFPVLRMGLSDAQELRNAIGRIEVKMGYDIPVRDLNGTGYWRVAEDGMPLGLYITILDQQLALTAFPVNSEDKLLAGFLGHEMPSQSIASTNALAVMNNKKGYTSHGSGILDIQKLADEMLNPDSATNSYLGPDSGYDPASLAPSCVSEINSMVAKTPRMTAGTTKLTGNEIGMRYELEIENTLASSLAALVSNTPAAVDGDHLVSGSLAIQIGKLRNFIFEKANAIVTTPYQCEQLHELNQNAMELVTQLNVPMPPMVNNLLGARVILDEFDPSTEPPTGNGLVAIHVDKPEMFVGMASMMVPGFDQLDLANQAEPVRIPSEILQVEGYDVFAMMGENAIGAALGEQQATELGAFMSAKSQDNGTFFSISYDMAKQLEIQEAMSEKFGISKDEDHSHSDELSEAVRESYADMLGRSRVDMRFTSTSLVVDSNISFK